MNHESSFAQWIVESNDYVCSSGPDPFAGLLMAVAYLGPPRTNSSLMHRKLRKETDYSFIASRALSLTLI